VTVESLGLTAPESDRSILAQPAWERWPDLARSAWASAGVEATVAGESIGNLRRVFRRDVLAQAEGTGGVGEDDRPLIVSGHQPELFHPGVWIKSFASAIAARSVGGKSLHVRIDNDTLKASAIRVPAGGPELFILGHVPFDRWESEIPYEDRDVVDEAIFADFPERVRTTLSKLPFTPMVDRYWQEVLRAGRETKNVGLRFARGRSAIEREMGFCSGEISLSELCRSRAFACLVAQLTGDALAFRDVYNGVLADYRTKHGVRSRNHPASDLEQVGERIETPFWIWHTHLPHRRAMWIERRGDWIDLRAGHDVLVTTLPASPAGIVEGIDSLLRSPPPCWKIRPRALMTTLFLRLFLADLFVHGLGGGKYEEATDGIIRRYLGVQPPTFAVMTATLLLPAGHSTQGMRSADWRRTARDLYWNPDRHLDDVLREHPPIEGWIESKIAWQATSSTNSNERKRRFRELRTLNDRLRAYVEADRESALSRAESAAEAERSQKILASREYAFCLHPWESIESLVAKLDSSSKDPA
jgi:hypothetical protein